MVSFQQALANFGRDIGLSTLESGPRGDVQLRLESGALVGIAQEGEQVVIHWAEPVRYDIAGPVLRAMKLAGKTQSAQYPIQVGLRSSIEGDWLVVTTRFSEAEASASRIHQASDYLRSWIAQSQST